MEQNCTLENTEYVITNLDEITKGHYIISLKPIPGGPKKVSLLILLWQQMT